MYFVSPTLANIKRIAEDLDKGLYEAFHLNFVEPLSRALLEELAAMVARDGTGDLIQQVSNMPYWWQSEDSDSRERRYWTSIYHSSALHLLSSPCFLLQNPSIRHPLRLLPSHSPLAIIFLIHHGPLNKK